MTQFLRKLQGRLWTSLHVAWKSNAKKIKSTSLTYSNSNPFKYDSQLLRSQFLLSIWNVVLSLLTSNSMTKFPPDDKTELIGKSERGIDIPPSPSKKQPIFCGRTRKRSLSRHSRLWITAQCLHRLPLSPSLMHIKAEVRLHTQPQKPIATSDLQAHFHYVLRMHFNTAAAKPWH